MTTQRFFLSGLCMTATVLTMVTPCEAQPQWEQLASFPHTTYAPSYFSIADHTFCGEGINGISPLAYCADFYEYLPGTDEWVSRTACPGPHRYGARGFSVAGLGFMACGWSNDPLEQMNDVWAYDPIDDSWEQRVDFPGPPRYTAISTATTTKGYLGLGYAPYMNDWWEYDPLLDEWTEKAPFPGGERQSAFSFVLNDMVFVGGGSADAYNALSDLWRYDPATDTWNTCAPLPAGRYASYAVTFEGKGLVIAGAGFSGFNVVLFQEVWSYNAAQDSWTQYPDFPGLPRLEGLSCNRNQSDAYLGMGRKSFDQVPFADNITSEFWHVYKPGIPTSMDARPRPEHLLVTPGLMRIGPVVGSDNAEVSVMDAAGRLVHRSFIQAGSTLEIRTEGWDAGVYHIHCTGAEDWSTSTVVLGS